MEKNDMFIKVYLRKDGQYSIFDKKGGQGDGSALYGKTVEEVFQKQNTLLSKTVLVDKSLFCGDICEWLKSVKISCKQSSYSNYEYTVYAHLIPAFGGYKRTQINKDMIHDFTEKMICQGLAPKTIKDILVILQQILRYHHLDIDVTMPRVPKKKIQILTQEDQLLLERRLSSCLDADSFGIILCLYTGLRIGELCALQWKNIDLKNRFIRVEKTLIRVKNEDSLVSKKTVLILDNPKTVSSHRMIPIPSFLFPILKKFRKEDDCFFLTGKRRFIEPRSYTNHYRNIMKSIALDYNFHALRHTFATRCIEKGCDPKTLSEILGHSSVKITLDRYVHPSFDSKVKMMNHLNPMCRFL